MGKRARLRPKHLAEKLRQIRLSLGLSQTDMLRQLGLEDVIHYSRISEYELGKNEPPLPVILGYARAANISTDFLIDDELGLPAKLPKHSRR
jgi:transcriptional regulator with XRE-family HTH domain